MRRTLAAMLAGGLVAAALTACCPDGSGGDLPPDAPIAAFYGDSYTLGTGASDPSLRWSTRIAVSRGWREVNPSRNGLGFVNNRESLRADLPGQIIDAEPDLVIVTMGLNDVFSYDTAAAGIHRQIERDLTRLSDALPDARIVVVEPFWYTEARPDALETIIDWVEEEAADIGADHIAGASRWIGGRDGLMAPDDQHPNDEGYAVITEKMDAALASLGL